MKLCQKTQQIISNKYKIISTPANVRVDIFFCGYDWRYDLLFNIYYLVKLVLLYQSYFIDLADLSVWLSDKLDANLFLALECGSRYFVCFVLPL